MIIILVFWMTSLVTFISHGLTPEVNILRARVVVSDIFKLIISVSEKILKNINVVV